MVETITIATMAQLQEALNDLARIPPANATFTPRELVIDEGDAPYDFAHATQAYPIRYRGLTIRGKAGKNVILRNVKLQIDLDVCDGILIQNIAFRSNGNADRARDAIELLSLGTLFVVRPPTISVRITQCSFDGYFDIAIDSSVRAPEIFPDNIDRGVFDHRSKLVATVDQCLFFDSNPGQPLELTDRNVYQFVNRGAINVTSAEHDGRGNSLFTIHNNVFIDVWRRSPRVAEGNQAFIFNNLLFRWGFGNDADPELNGTNEWVGIEADNGASVAIYANRFIPYDRKQRANKTINIDSSAKVDIGPPPAGGPDNEFDRPDGRTPSPAGLPPTNVTPIDVGSWYQSLNLVAPTPATLTNAGWIALLNDAGRPTFDNAVKGELLDLLEGIENGSSPV